MPEEKFADFPTIQGFHEAVIKQFSVSCAGATHSYSQYLTLPFQMRSNDEADVVDTRFTQAVLEWLDFHKSDGSYQYNRSATTPAASSVRPDFEALGLVGTAFIWEDKNTTEEFSEDHLEQIRKYVAGSSGYALWSNARSILGFLFDAKGHHQILLEVNIESIFASDKPDQAVLKEQNSALETFRLLFSRSRFTSFDSLLAKICVDEQTFFDHARELDDPNALKSFIDGSRQVLYHLKLAVLQQVVLALKRKEVIPHREEALIEEWNSDKQQVIEQLSQAVTPEGKQALRILFGKMEQRFGELTNQDFLVERFLQAVQGDASKTKRVSVTNRSVLDSWLVKAKRNNAALRHLRLSTATERQIGDAFQVWVERQPLPSLGSPEIYAEQVAYVLFMRLLLARILEDKNLLDQRIASNGGFKAWRDIIVRYFGKNGSKIHADSFMALLSESLSRYYHHFFQQPVFDWFVPDDYMLLESLEFLGRFNFRQVTSDVLGFTYEQYIDRIARNKKGHFLTRPEVVDYMLEQAGYAGPTIIGKRLMDPACGSGSFLVHAARRYREALVESISTKNNFTIQEMLDNLDSRRELADRMLDGVTTLFYGIDIDPFACYLAELNLLIQVLEDLHFLWTKDIRRSIERFCIFEADSLSLPQSVMHSNLDSLNEHDFALNLADEVVDETFPIKSKSGLFRSGFSFVISNPPYISPKQEQVGVDYHQFPFFQQVLTGDANTYLLFLRLGIHYLAQEGTLCFIVPLTLLGGRSSNGIRALASSHGLSVKSLLRFYTGNVLFPGIDQATTIIVLHKGEMNPKILIGGGSSIKSAKESQIQIDRAKVIEPFPVGHDWRPWLVSPDVRAYKVWNAVSNFSGVLGSVINAWFEVQQGDVNATHVNQLRLAATVPASPSDVSLYSGENILRFAPLPDNSQKVRPKTDDGLSSTVKRANREINRIASLQTKEIGLVMREVARLNTRYQFTATKFIRDSGRHIAFDHGLWRFQARQGITEEKVDAFLAILCSHVTPYLLNLFSTNNNISLEDLKTVPIPPIDTLPESGLATLSGSLLSMRAKMETDYCQKYGAVLPERGQNLTLPPDIVLTKSAVPLISLSDAQLRGIIKISGTLRKVRTMLRTNQIEFSGSAAFETGARLILAQHEKCNWNDVANTVLLPDPGIADLWFADYNRLLAELRQVWASFLNTQTEIDNLLCDWYVLDEESIRAIKDGLPWAQASPGFDNGTM